MVVSVLNKIKKKRIEKGYSQEYMANMLEMERNNYFNLESGKVKLTLERLYKIAEILQIDVSYFIESKGSEKLFNDFRIHDLPLKSVAEEQEVIYYRNDLRTKLLEQENQLLKKALEDKDEIIRLLKESKKE